MIIKIMGTAKHDNNLNIFLSATILINLFCLFINGYGADLGYWENWTHQLATTGYRLFNGNYPPLYIHWLYLVAKGLNYFQLPIEPNDLCKFLWEFPVLLGHCLLTWVVFRLLQQFHATREQMLSVMLLTVFNPAILIDGPVWGQVDLLPSVLALCAILIHFSSRYSILMLPLFTLSLLTKFQMVCFCPIVGILFFHRIKTHLLGIVFSLLIIAFVFLPFIVVGFYKEAFKQAYIDTLGQYPVITMNAANLWVLLIGNNAPDNIQFLDHVSALLPQKLVYPKYLGMFLYAAICLAIFIFGINDLIKSKYSTDKNKFITHILFYALVSATAFFTLLPAMHERYLFPAVVAAIIYVAVARKQLAYPLAISMASALNMLIILGINGSNIWVGLSVLVTGVMFVSLLQLIAGNSAYTVIEQSVKNFLTIRFATPIIFIVSVSLTLHYLVDRYSIHKITLQSNQSLLTNYPMVSAHQDYGTVQYGRSVENKVLSVGDRRFANGIGTHANSIIVYNLPANAISFDVIPGLDDEISAADVIFQVLEDNTLLWSSAPYYGNEKAIPVHINLHKGKQLTLKVDSHGETSWDHADWINPIITTEAIQP